MKEKAIDSRWVKIFTITSGLTLFAYFFGAGNLMFPPYFGGVGGKMWIIGAIGFIVGDVFLILCGLYASTKFPNAPIIGVFYRNGKMLEKVLAWCFIIGGSWLVVLPRCGYLFHSFVTNQFFPGVGSWVTAIFYFGLSLILAINPSKIIDIVGKYLTPILVVAIIILFAVGAIKGIHSGEPMVQTGELFKNGLISGYMTIDLMGSTIESIIIIVVLKEKGINDTKFQSKIVMKAAVIAAILLTIVYMGLTWLGSGFSQNIANVGEDQATYLVTMIQSLFGNVGYIVMAVVLGLAVLTTSTAVIAGCGQLGRLATDNKLSAKAVDIISAVIAGVISIMGAGQLITFATMVVLAVYPVIFANVVLTIFTDKIRNDNVFRGASVGSLVFGILISLAQTYPEQFRILSPVLKLPLVNYYLGWLIPTIICAVIGGFVKYKGFEDRPFLRENALKSDNY
jgi:LIVCS family branched-chain amino acid:cation transporter